MAICIFSFYFSSYSRCYKEKITQKNIIDKDVVKELDIKRYLGKWYEISRYDHSFERDLVGVTATYSYREDGMIKVVNSGYEKTLQGKGLKQLEKQKFQT